MSSYRIGTVIIALVCLQGILFTGSAFGQMREVWSQTYDSESTEVATCATQLTDGGFVLGGFQDDPRGNVRWLLKRLADNGELSWSTEGPGERDTSYIRDLLQTAEGNLVSVGSKPSRGTDAFVVCSDIEGNIIWTNQFGEAESDFAGKLVETENGSIYFSGTCVRGDQQEDSFWLVMLNGNDGLAWERFYRLGDNNRNTCNSMIRTDDGNLLLAGTTRSDHYTGFVVKTNLDGEVIWSHEYEGADIDSRIIDVASAEDGGYVFIGGTYIREGLSSRWLFKTNPDGEILWERFYEPERIQPSFNSSIVPADDGGYFYTESQEDDWNPTVLRRVDNNGFELWSMVFNELYTVNNNELIVLDQGLFLAGSVLRRNLNSCALRLGPEEAVWGAPPLLEFREDDSMMVRRDTFDPCTYHHGRPDSLFRYEVLEQGGFLMGENFQGNIHLTTTPNFWGLDSVQVSVLDMNDEGGSAWVKCNITPVNDPPSAPILFRPGRGGIWREDTLSMMWMPSRQNPWETDTVSYTLIFTHGESQKQYANLSDTLLLIPVEDLLTEMNLNRTDSALTIAWWVIASDSEFDVESTTRRTFTLPWLEAGEDDLPAIPTELAISKIYPNPFNNRATISFELPFAGAVSLALYDLSGKKAADLSNGHYSAGSHTLVWDAANLPAGVYLLKLSDGRSVAKVERVVLLN